jgi:hypothetical protein
MRNSESNLPNSINLQRKDITILEELGQGRKLRKLDTYKTRTSY